MPSISNNPVPLGIVTVVTPGVLVPLTVNFPALRGNDDIRKNLHACGLHVMCDAGGVAGVTTPTPNTGRVYIGYSNINRTTLAGVLFWVDPGGQMWYPQYSETNTLMVDKMYMDADNAGDWALITAKVGA